MKMEAKLLSCESGSNISDEDFIDMEVSSFSTFFSASVASPPRNNRSEFEFKMETELTTSPADELFYKGKLLPLHLPPRLQMVEKLLQNSAYRSKDVDFDELYATPLTATLTTPTAAHTPYESCNISPFESRQASRELNAQEYFAEYYYPAGLNLSSVSLAALMNPLLRKWQMKGPSPRTKQPQRPCSVRYTSKRTQLIMSELVYIGGRFHLLSGGIR